MAQLNAIAAGDAHQRRLSQEASGPVLLRMQAAKPAGAFRQLGKQVAVAVPEPGIESARADAFGDVRMPMVTTRGRTDGLGMAWCVGDGVICLAEEFGAKIGDIHSVRFLLWILSGTQDAVGIFNPHSN